MISHKERLTKPFSLRQRGKTKEFEMSMGGEDNFFLGL